LKKVVFVAKVSNFFHGYLLEVEYFKSVNFERYDPIPNFRNAQWAVLVQGLT
jgi:hypothetical protein